MSDPQLPLFGDDPVPEPEPEVRPRRWGDPTRASMRSPAHNRAIWEETHRDDRSRR